MIMVIGLLAENNNCHESIFKIVSYFQFINVFDETRRLHSIDNTNKTKTCIIFLLVFVPSSSEIKISPCAILLQYPIMNLRRVKQVYNFYRHRSQQQAANIIIVSECKFLVVTALLMMIIVPAHNLEFCETAHI